MLQGCFVNWNQQPTCHLQDFQNSATLSSRLGMIFLLLDNAIFVLIITMMWEIFYARGFWKVCKTPASCPGHLKVIALTFCHSNLGCSSNQNGNLRWIFQWRGRGVMFQIRILKKTFRIIPWLWKRVLHLVWDLYYVYIVVEMTLNMAK